MRDIPLAKAQVLWSPDEGHEGPPVVVKTRGDKDDQDYLSCWGASNSDFNAASPDAQLRMLLAQAIFIAADEKVSMRKVSAALSVIPEFREAMTEVGVHYRGNEPQYIRRP